MNATGATAVEPVRDGSADDTPLKRAISQRLLTLFMLGNIVGAGIYVLVGTVAQEVGGALWVPFLVALGLSVLTAASYAELVTKYPRAGGSSIYVERAFRSRMLGFLTGFVVLASGITTTATLVISFGGEYLQELVAVPAFPASIALLLLIVAINLLGARESIGISVALTLVELGGLVIIVVIAAGIVVSGDGDPGRAVEFADSDHVFALVLSGAALAFFAFTGFDATTNLAEEVRNPSRAYPRALFVSLGIAGVFYLAVTILTSIALPTPVLSRSDAPLIEVVRTGGDWISPDTFAVISLLSVASSALVNVVTSSRLLWGMSDARLVPPFFSRLLPGRRTPLTATLAIALVAAVLVVTGDVSSLVGLTSSLLLAVFVLVNASAILLRKARVGHDHFEAPIVVPVLGIVACLALLAQQDLETFWHGALLVGVGLALWGLAELRARRTADRGGAAEAAREGELEAAAAAATTDAPTPAPS